MGLTRLAINRPLSVLMLIVGLVLMGGVSYTKMKIDRFPAISFPAVFVNIPYPGAAPTDVEDLVARPVENAVSGLPGIDTITSTSSEGAVTLSIRFVEGTDTSAAALDVERRLASVRGRLPEDVGTPSVTKADASSIPVMNIAMSGKRAPAELFDIANDTILPRLQSVDGVADVTLSGGLEREIHVQVDFNRLRAYGLSLQSVQTALERENVSSPSGRVNTGPSSQSIRAVGVLRTLDDLRNLTVQTNPRLIRLQDVATVTDSFREQTRLQRFNGEDAIGFVITKQADANSVRVADNVKAAVAQLQVSIPRDVSMTITNDASRFTRRSLDSVINDLNIGVLLTGIVLLLFLHTWRNTFIVLLAIPTSLISTFLVMYFSGFSLNIISLMALALTIGILVDDSIVVLENITRHLELGEEPRAAALQGRSEIGLAAMAITLVDVIVFLPVSFMTGNIGRLFKEFGITIATATLLSLFISFTLTPMLASRFLKTEHGKERGPLARFGRFWDRGYDRLAAGYRGLLGLGLRLRWVVVLVGFGALAGAIAMVQFNIIGSEYAPAEDDGLFTVNLTMPPGTSLAGTDAATRRLEDRLRRIPEIENLFTSVGSGGFGSNNTRSSNISVQLVDKHNRQRTVFEVLTDARRAFREIPEARIRASVSSPLAGGGGSGINIRLLGDDLDKLSEIAARVEESVRNVPGAVDVQNNAQERDPELRAVLDRERLADLRISADSVASIMRTMIGGTVVTQLRPDGANQVDVLLIAADAERANAAQIGSIPLIGGGDGTALVRLDQVARLVQDSGPARIQRTDRQRVIEVTGGVSGRSLGDVTRDIRAATNPLPLPEGYRLVMAGQVQQQEQAFLTLVQALSLSVVLIYMLMVALYESWLTPFAIMFSLPVALVGAFGGLFLTGNTFNIFSMIGMIMLMGLVGKNAILLIDFTDTLRKRGLARREAILEAGYTRLRPILMTTCTIVFAMLPLALKLEEGGESRAPLAVVIIGGVISSTLLTLVLVPAVYTILDDAKEGVIRLRRRLTRRAPAPEAVTAPARVRTARVLSAPPPARGGSED
jgi:hydrophobic/amphiphilic exporter-1 (mainly G- bacteria), HAE1 family